MRLAGKEQVQRPSGRLVCLRNKEARGLEHREGEDKEVILHQ